MSPSTKPFDVELIRNTVLEGISDKDAGIEFIDSTGWMDGGKYDYCSYHFRDLSDGRVYGISDSRSGSYFSDYYYESSDWRGTIECVELRRHTKIVNEWIPTESPPREPVDYLALVTAAREFIAKVDSGQARSVASYVAFKTALGGPPLLAPTEVTS